MSQLLVQQADINRAVNQPHFQSSSQSDDKLTINDLVEMRKKGFTPVLSSSDVIECEKNFHQAGQYRRICLSLLSKSSQDLIQNLAKHPDLIDSMLDVFDAWEERLKGQSEILDTARARFLVIAAYVNEEA